MYFHRDQEQSKLCIFVDSILIYNFTTFILCYNFFMEFYPLDKGIHLFQIEFKVDLHWGFTKPSSMSSIQPRALCRRRGPSVISLWRCPTLAEIAASQLSPNQRTGSNSWRQRGQILPFYLVLWYNEEFFQKLQIQYFQRILSPSWLLSETSECKWTLTSWGALLSKKPGATSRLSSSSNSCLST